MPVSHVAPARWAVIPARSAAPELWQRCRFAACLPFGPYDLAGRRRGVPFGSGGVPVPAPTIGPRGRAYAFHSSAANASILRYGFAPFTKWDTGDVTLFAFARHTVTGARAGLAVSDAALGRVALYVEPNSRLVGFVNSAGGTTALSASAGLVDDQETFSGAFTQTGTLRSALYLNGALIASTAAPTPLPTNSGGVLEWVLGSAHQSWANGFDTGWGGLIYTVLVWDRALAAQEIGLLAEDPFRMFRRARRRTGPSGDTPAPVSLDLGVGALSLAEQPLALAVGQSRPLGTGTIFLDEQPQSVSAGQARALGSASLTFVGQPLGFTSGASVELDLGAGALTLAGQALDAQVGVRAPIGAGAILLAEQPQSVSAGQARALGSASLVLAGQPLSVISDARVALDLGAGLLTLTGQALDTVMGVRAPVNGPRRRRSVGDQPVIEHTGQRIPIFPERWDPADKEWIWMVWDHVLDGAALIESTWTLPSGWTQHGAEIGQSVVDNSDTHYALANGVLLSNPNVAVGTLAAIANKVVLSDGREYERSVMLVVAQQ